MQNSARFLNICYVYLSDIYIKILKGPSNEDNDPNFACLTDLNYFKGYADMQFFKCVQFFYLPFIACSFKV